MLTGPVGIVVDYDPAQVSTDAVLVEVSPGMATVRTSLELEPGQSVQIIPGYGANRAVATRVVQVSKIDRLGVFQADLDVLRST